MNENKSLIHAKMQILRQLSDEQRLKYELLVDRARKDGYPESAVVFKVLEARVARTQLTHGACVDSIYAAVEGVQYALKWPGRTFEEIRLAQIADGSL